MIAKGSEEWMLFKDYYDLFGRYNESMTGDVEKDNKTWEQYFVDADKFRNNYKSKYAEKLLMAYEEYLIHKQKKEPV